MGNLVHLQWGKGGIVPKTAKTGDFSPAFNEKTLPTPQNATTNRRMNYPG
jgi:hypothetical protein